MPEKKESINNENTYVVNKTTFIVEREFNKSDKSLEEIILETLKDINKSKEI